MNPKSWARVLPWLAGFLYNGATPGIADGIGHQPTLALGLFLGLGVGWGWFRLYPRDLADRLLVGAFWVVAGGILLLVPGVEFDSSLHSDAFFFPVGVLAGLVFTQTRTERIARSSRRTGASR